VNRHMIRQRRRGITGGSDHPTYNPSVPRRVHRIAFPGRCGWANTPGTIAPCARCPSMITTGACMFHHPPQHPGLRLIAKRADVGAGHDVQPQIALIDTDKPCDHTLVTSPDFPDGSKPPVPSGRTDGASGLIPA
jgi:hypothetical protein